MAKMMVLGRQQLGQTINWLWRWMMTACCFVLFGVGGMLLSLYWFSHLLLTQRYRQPQSILARRCIAGSFQLLLKAARGLGLLDYQIHGLEKLQADKGCLIVANHPTLLDYVILASRLPEIDCLVKAELLHNPFISQVIKAADYLINSEAPRLLSTCRRRLQRGDTILLFPEGTRSRPGKALTLQRGAANIVLHCACDVRIVHIHCSQQLLGKQSRWYHIPPSKPRFSIVVGARITYKQFVAQQTQALTARQLNRQLALLLTPEPGKRLDRENASTRV